MHIIPVIFLWSWALTCGGGGGEGPLEEPEGPVVTDIRGRRSPERGGGEEEAVGADEPVVPRCRERVLTHGDTIPGHVPHY